MSTTFETSKPGDRVFSHTFGWGTVVGGGTQTYPVHVIFDNHPDVEWYTSDGCYYNGDDTQSLFWGECAIEAPSKPSKFVNDKAVLDNSSHSDNQEYHHYPALRPVYISINFLAIPNRACSI